MAINIAGVGLHSIKSAASITGAKSMHIEKYNKVLIRDADAPSGYYGKVRKLKQPFSC
jgi:hypothetical protein